ncbi:hypothetical protein KI387_012865, partial [Taxus chinensis]
MISCIALNKNKKVIPRAEAPSKEVHKEEDKVVEDSPKSGSTIGVTSPKKMEILGEKESNIRLDLNNDSGGCCGVFKGEENFNEYEKETLQEYPLDMEDLNILMEAFKCLDKENLISTPMNSPTTEAERPSRPNENKENESPWAERLNAIGTFEG